ncbi:MAG: glycosyltransferase [Geminicoccaceae bacterium]
MRLLIVCYEYPPFSGGGGIAVQGIARELARRHAVHVLTGAARGEPAETRDGAIRIFRAPGWPRQQASHSSFASMVGFWPFGTLHGYTLLKRHPYDLINTWFAVPSGPTGVHLAAASGVPHVLTLAGGDVYDPAKRYTPDKSRLLAAVVRRVLKAADMRVAVSSDLARRAVALYGCPPPLEVISLGLASTMPAMPPAAPLVADPSGAGAPDRRGLGLDPDALYVVSLARLVRRKNLTALVEACAAVGVDNVRLLLLGDGPERQPLEQLARERGFDSRIQFKGFVDEAGKQAILRAADIFALPSLHEAFGLVYLEAMQAGLPIIATRAGGQEDFLENGVTAHLVEAGDAAALVAALDHLAGDPVARRRMGMAARAAAAAFTAEATAARYEALFERLVTPGTA